MSETLTPKFPVGSRVSVNVDGDTPAHSSAEQAWRDEWRGQVGTVEDFDVVDDFYTVRWDNNSASKVWTEQYLQAEEAERPVFHVGQRVAFTERWGAPVPSTDDGVAHVPGDVVTVTAVKDDTVRIDVDGDSWWGESWFDAAPEQPARPTVCLKAKGQHTALEYAQGFPSRVIEEPHNGVLKALAAGEVVDAVAAQVALQYALSSVSHRFGQSMVRRQKAREVRHVLHIVNAIIAAHIDGLPAFDSTAARSRAVAERDALIDEAGTVLAEARAEVERLTAAVSALTADLDESAETIVALRTDRDNQIVRADQAEARGSRLAHVVNYARRLLGPEGAKQIDGYIDGWIESIQSGN